MAKGISFKGYNKELFTNMATFVDAVLVVDLVKATVQVLHDKISNHLTGNTYSYDEFKVVLKEEYGVEDERVSSVISSDFVWNLVGSYTFETKLKRGKNHHVLKCVVTPSTKDGEKVEQLFLSVFDMQKSSDTIEKKEQKENKAVGMQPKQVAGILSSATVGIWSIVLGEGRPRFYMDSTTAFLVGVKEDVTPEEAYEAWYSHVDTNYKDDVAKCVANIQDGQQDEVIYPYHHPSKGEITIRCGGVLDKEYEGIGKRLNGYHQEVSANSRNWLEQVEICKSFAKLFQVARLVDVETGKYKKFMSEQLLVPEEDGRMQDFMSMVYKSSEYVTANRLEFLEFMNLFTMGERLEQKDTISLEFCMDKQGWTRVLIIPVLYGENKKIKKVLCLFQNINEEKQKETETQQLYATLKDYKKNTAETLASTGSGLWVMVVPKNGEKPKLILNNEVKRLMGIRVDAGDEECYDIWVKNINKSDKFKIEDWFKDMQRGRTAEVSYRFYRPRKGEAVVRDVGSMKMTEDSDKQIYRGYVQDVTFYHSQMESYYALTESLSRLYQNVYVVNLKENTFEQIRAGDEMEEYLGKKGTVPEFAQKYIDNVDDLNGKLRVSAFVDLSTLTNRLRGKDMISCEYKGRILGWSRAYILPTGYDANADVEKFIFVIQQIGEEKQKELDHQWILMEAQKEALKANAAKTQFLQNMSHDMRTPMNAIVGMAEIAMKNMDDQVRVEDCLKKIDVSSKQLMILINEVLDMSKLESEELVLEYKPFDLLELLDTNSVLISAQAEAKEIQVNFHKEEKIKYRYLIGAPIHLKKIIMNVCSNAVMYNKEGGKVDLYLKEKRLNKDTVEVRFICTDTGIGMSEEFLQKVFNPFMQEKQDARTTYGGTGLGLSIVKKVVEHMGGTIEILSKQNIGTTVTIVIPFELDKNPPVSMEEEPIAELTNLEGVKILMVEDNFLNREIANYMLKEVGAIVTNVENGLEAVELFEEQPADTFDLILMDIMMPVMDGLEATRQIRKLKREDARTIPIIALTANAFASDIQDCKDAGMNAHIAKPLIMENLFDALKGLKR